VFQQFNLIPTLSAEENVAIAMVPRESSHEKRIARASELLGQVGLDIRSGTCRRACRAVSSSEWPSPGRWSTRPR
jgi:predicted ABC-type transport system involved in lysophospholipase L1 biosynthesis ATPase subunit